ncbi:hypothetical protein [Bradyrhizobium sp. RDI18]|uniref:hypothetical protein n=1 Tax=Bradyrhizobium sp. RDI18 TaxID=3367400 RepID=UPI00371F72F4
MTEVKWGWPAYPVKPICTFGLVAQPLELTTRLPNDIGVDSLQGRTQLALVGDPATNARIVHPSGSVADLSMMQRPAACHAIDPRNAFGLGRGLEAVRENAPARLRSRDLSGSKLEAEKVKVDVVLPRRFTSLVVDNLRFLLM